jgi:hypothetical protein
MTTAVFPSLVDASAAVSPSVEDASVDAVADSLLESLEVELLPEPQAARDMTIAIASNRDRNFFICHLPFICFGNI